MNPPAFGTIAPIVLSSFRDVTSGRVKPMAAKALYSFRDAAGAPVLDRRRPRHRAGHCGVVDDADGWLVAAGTLSPGRPRTIAPGAVSCCANVRTSFHADCTT